MGDIDGWVKQDILQFEYLAIKKYVLSTQAFIEIPRI